MKLTRKGTTMKFKATIATCALALTAAVSVSASSERKGDLNVTKECSAYTGLPGAFCTITSSDLAAIPVGSKVFYGQASGIPAGLLDSDVVLDAGAGNRAVGHCTLDSATGRGLCTFSDGMGHLAGFQARVDVSYTGGVNFRWDGVYSFSQEHRR